MDDYAKHDPRSARKRRSWWPFGRRTLSIEEQVGWNRDEFAHYGAHYDPLTAPKHTPHPSYPQGEPLGQDLVPYKAPSRKWFWIRRGMAALFLLLALLLLWLAFTAPLSKSLQPIVPPQLTLTTSNGEPISRSGAIVDLPVEMDKLPPHVAQAFMAIEDRRFYSHWGVDPRGIARAAWYNLTTDRTQGGSTITQQLAKFTFLNSEQTMTRKARELLISFWLEGRLSKDEIFERYLSNVYFGDNVYGLRAASLHYFYRRPENLTLAQAAMLAGVVQAPSRLAPTKHPKNAAKRARMVLNAMVAAGYLTEAKAAQVSMARTDLRLSSSLPSGTYFADWAMPQAREKTDQSYAKQTIATTLDSRLQDAARRAVGRAPLGNAQVALVAMRPNGEVVAMIGGRSYKSSSFNRATQARRQPGSTFKLFVYLAALRSGMSPDSIIDDSPISSGSYRPKNSGGKYRGQIPLREAFAQSSNVAAVRLYQKVGSAAVLRAARDLGVKSPLAEDDPSLALGTSGVTLMELTAAYAAIAANNRPVTPSAFPAQEQSWLSTFTHPRRSLGSGQHEKMEELLRAVVTNGTGGNARLNVPSYGKSGTSQDSRDALYVGYAGDLVVGIWVGNDDNSPLKNISGSGLPARIWRDFMAQAVKGASPVKVRQKPRPKILADPDGPVKPLDLPEIPDIPIDLGGTDIRINRNQGVTVSTDIGNLPVDLTIGNDGIDLRPREKPPENR
ncbi:MAG: PBP1A family penicillin-binding protein [Sphingorhabdus sp.]|nr:PBP1A family penicillin-binding protein [Sphingorhabdus sp.]